MTTRFSLGIDLGTTNSAIAFTDLDSDRAQVFEVTQILGPNQIGEKPTLPSALYIPHRDEFPENSFPLPWEDDMRKTRFCMRHACRGGTGTFLKRRSFSRFPHHSTRLREA